MRPDLLATNFAPSDIEAGPSRTSIEEHERTFADIDRQISSEDLECPLEELRMRRLSLVESSTIQKALLAPIRKPAPEILGEVFEWCISVTINAQGISTRTPHSAPLLLLRVRRRWRRVSVGTRQLWTNLGVQWPIANPLIMIPMWLQYSRSLPVNIYIGTERSQDLLALGHRPSMPIRKFIFQCISEHVHRCRVFHYEAGSDSLRDIFPPGRHIVLPFP
jgi:hypothetical protein